MSTFWETVTIPLGETRHWQISLLDLWVQRREGEWRVWHKIKQGAEFEDRYSLAEISAEPEESGHIRYAFDDDQTDLRIEPRFPDRPIISYPGSPVIVPPQCEASFVCGIPLGIELIAGSGASSIPLTTLPLRRLSKTWFGSPQEGEACYSSSTEAVRDFREIAANKYRALCPLKVTNKTNSPLPIERICIHVEHLQLLNGRENLWTNEVYVKKESVYETSQVSYGSGAPSVDPDATMKLSPRVVPPHSRLFLKTFNQLKTALGSS